MLPSNAYSGQPLLTVSLVPNASTGNILCVLKMSGLAKVVDPIIESVAIPVIEFGVGIFAVVKYPSQPATVEDTTIGFDFPTRTAPLRLPPTTRNVSGFPRAPLIYRPPKNAGFWVIG